MGSYADLLGISKWRTRALFGMALAAVGLGTFWGVCVATQDITRELLLNLGYSAAEADHKAKFAYGIVQVLGAGIGQLSFGPLCARWGRKPTFALMHVLSFGLIMGVCWLPTAYWQLLVLLPLFGFASLSIHAGYAIYFPELFPNHLRSTGASFCFNAGRLLAAPMLLLSGYVKALYSLQTAITLLGCLFLVGVVILRFLPETKGQELPE
jgi:MFS family permease